MYLKWYGCTLRTYAVSVQIDPTSGFLTDLTTMMNTNHKISKFLWWYGMYTHKINIQVHISYTHIHILHIWVIVLDIFFWAFWRLADHSVPLTPGQCPSGSRSPGRNKHIAKHCSNASSLSTGSPASIASTIEADWSVVCKRALSEPLSCRFKPLPARWCLLG